MKFDISVVLLLLIACMLGFVTYQSIDLVKAVSITAKTNIQMIQTTLKLDRKVVESIVL